MHLRTASCNTGVSYKRCQTKQGTEQEGMFLWDVKGDQKESRKGRQAQCQAPRKSDSRGFLYCWQSKQEPSTVCVCVCVFFFLNIQMPFNQFKFGSYIFRCPRELIHTTIFPPLYIFI